MANKNKESRDKYYAKLYEEAPIIECACGCGTQIKSMDKYGRAKKYVNGHNGRKYEDPKQYKREWNHRNRAKIQKAKINYHRIRKVKLLGHMGAKCANCGIEYNGKNAAIFEFHHKDPNTKEFQIGNNLVNMSWEKIIVESEKCELLCSNCHNLHHSEEF